MLWTCVGAFAQVITNDAPPVPETIGDNPAVFPATKSDFWQWGIAIVTPVIVWGISKIPSVPRPVLPTLAPLLGVALGAALNKLAELNLSWVDMTQAGAAAVAIREIFNQWVTKQMRPAEASKTHARPIDNAVAVKPGERAPNDPVPGERQPTVNPSSHGQK